MNPPASHSPDPSLVVWNVPNVLSSIRLVMAWIVFVLIEQGAFWTAFVLFVIAVGTDWVDGWWARKFNQVTKLGRILDPFCDKIIICGTFIQVAAIMQLTGWPWYLRIMPWMAVVVVARELLVTALRSAIEAAGGDFSASFAGKLKMLFQCIAIGSALVALAVSATSNGEASESAKVGGLTFELGNVPLWVQVVMGLSIWAAVWSTLSSGWDYVWAAIRFAKKPGETR
ncbi:MAG: CDP-diacylglycerol--glycerol-3-phosphate 3-phosphatidyltransferase [Planctomycetaceae bacterium]|nr:CDP-diacylglycerol--glycerol-3-phosphate 3-phosphatidyltransferase [Planctomycetaceae bacterium]